MHDHNLSERTHLHLDHTVERRVRIDRANVLEVFLLTTDLGISAAHVYVIKGRLLRRLAEVSSLQPGVKDVPPEQLTRRAYPLAQDLYPELMAKRVNTMPLGRLWIPLLDRKWEVTACGRRLV